MTDNSSPDFDEASSSAIFDKRAGGVASGPKVAEEAKAETLAVASEVRPRRGGMFKAFRHRNYRLFWVGAGISNLGNWMQMVGQNWLVLSLTGSPFLLGLVSFLANLPMLLLSLFGGVVADRNSRRTVLLVTQVLMALLVLMLAVLSVFGLINIWLVLLITVGIGTVQAFNTPAYQAIMQDLVEKEDTMNAVAMNSLQFNLTRIVGPAIGGVLISAVGVAACFFFNSISYLGVIVTLLLIRLPTFQRPVVKRSALAEIRESFGYLRQHREMLALMGIGAAVSLFIFPYITLLPVFVKQVFRSGPESYGLLMTAVGLGALVGALGLAFISSRPRGLGKFMLGGFAVALVALLGFGLSNNFLISLGMLALLGSAIVSANGAANTLVQTNVPDEMRGRIMSVWTLSAMGMLPIGSLQSGIVAENWGAPFAIVLNMCLLSVVLSLIVLFVPRLRQM